MSTEKYFSIIVKGSLSSEVEEGELNKETGLPAGPTAKLKLQVGAVAIPNASKVWAKRIKKGAKGAEVPTGELEFLKWRAEGGELVAIRYIEGVNTLDKLYQDNVLKVGPKSEEEINMTAFIDLNVGVNDYDRESADPMLISMLEHHTYCEDNESRNPSSSEIHYSIYNAKKANSGKVDQMRLDQKAQALILSAEGDSGRLAVFANIFDLDPKLQNEVLFDQLLEILEDEKQRIHDVVNFHKARYTHILTKLEDAGELEYTEDAVITIIDHQRDFLAKDIDPKIKDKKNYLLENMLEPELFEVYQKALEIDKQLLEQLN